MTFLLADLRSDVAADLRDVDGATWSQAQLDRAIAHAVAVYGDAAPREAEVVVNVTGRTVDLAAALPDFADLVRVVAVEFPVANWPPSYVRFDIVGRTLALHTDVELNGDSVRVIYRIQHTLTDVEGTIPDADRAMLATGAAGFALRQLATEMALSINTGGPRAVEHIRDAAELRIEAFMQQLHRRYGRRVRTRQAYRPDEPYLNRDVVQMPD